MEITNVNAREKNFFPSFFEEHSQSNAKKFEIYEWRNKKIHRMHVVPDIAFTALHILS